ncbi:MAG: hypothetical protein EA412_11140 [Chitinophagaceae bacterium]|nr:MAG: hypothetical protein EA412_11140 [Chitinophagaceae bacterium]
MSDKSALVLVSDAGYLDYTKQVFYSAVRYGNWKGDLVLIVCDVDSAELEWFHKRNITVLSPDALIDRKVNGWPRIVFQKLYLIHPMMKKWDKVVYLDTDVMIFRDINKLTNYNSFAAHKENADLNIRGQFILDKNLDEDGRELMKELSESYNLNRIALNVGVMVFNTDQNTDELFNEACRLLNRYESVLRYPEQAIFNLIFYKKWKNLPYYFNDYTFFFYKKDVEKNKFLQLIKRKSKILHFIGEVKPWHETCYFHEEWKENLAEAENLPLVDKIGEVPSSLTDLRRTWYRNMIKFTIFFAHLSWLTGRLLHRISPAAYHFLKRFI